MNINWLNIRTIENSQNEGFEELIRQLARREGIANKQKFVPLGKPDAGVECYWVLNNGDEWGWQAKYFTNSFDDVQWRQIDESVTTVLEKRPNLKKYTIAFPINPPEAKQRNQTSLLDKWNARVAKWEQLAKDKGLTIAFEPWWSSDIISRLAKPENAGLTYFFFNKEEFTAEWFYEQTEESIFELGNRYTSELNVKLEVSKIFSGIARDEKFEDQIKTVFDDVFIKGNKIVTHEENLKNEVAELRQKLEILYQLFTNCEFRGVDNLPYFEFETLLNSIEVVAENLKKYYIKIEQELWNKDKKREYSYYQKYGSKIHNLDKFSSSLINAGSFISGYTAQLSNKPVLLLDGEAGIGKSHLIADIVRTRSTEGKFSILLLGQHFVSDEAPWTQILKRLGIKCTLDEFLGALNSKAEGMGSRLILFVDAMNEGRGKYFWGDNVKSFIKKITKYKWLGLVLSVRSSYKRLIFPPDDWPTNSIVQYTHYGFREIEYEATKLFFSAYKIQLPSVPLLHPEFQNPLFLKLFCDGLNKAGYLKIPDGLQGITSITDFFITSINLKVSKPERLEYSSSINIAKKAINVLIAEKIDKKLRYIPYESAYILVEKILTTYSAKRGLLDELISEGLFSKNLFWKSNNNYEEGVYLAYERFEDYLTASFLLEKTKNIESAFKKGGELFYIVEDIRACSLNKGLIEAFSVQLPERTGKELYEYVSHLKNSIPVIESFVQSLIWRKIDTISDKLIDYVNACVLPYEETYNLFLDTILSVTAVPNHYFNAYSLHRKLMDLSLADRDAEWTIFLKDQYYDDTAIKRLIDWGWSDESKEHISDESIKLVSIALAWFHTSTNRKLRDSATKALVCLLENRINVLIEVLKVFEAVNDPYIYERLFAVAFGCAVRTKQIDFLPDLSLYIFVRIFDHDGEIYPHILLRDYARGVIEYTLKLGYALDVDANKIRPPYKSSFPKHFPTNEEIDKTFKFDYNSEGFKDYYWAQNSILSSMVTEYGRGIASYGDFGRYVFQRGLEAWKLDENALSNLAVKWIFENYGYDVEIHGEFDRKIGSGRGRDTYPHERIGKKYQWLSFYEILARVSDNFPKYAEWGYGKEIGEQYEGPWSPYIRDIDPTITIKVTGKNNEEKLPDYWWVRENYSHWDLQHKEWIKQTDDFPLMESLINVVAPDGTEWLVLKGYPEWEQPKPLGFEKYDVPHKRLWIHINSCFVNKKDFGKLLKWAKEQSSMGRWIPEHHERYQVFSGEYYWSAAYRYFEKEYYGGVQWEYVRGDFHNKKIALVMRTCEGYHWEEEFDQSKDFPLHILKPCADLFEKMDMVYSEREGEFLDRNGKLICFDPSVHHNSEGFLLIKKESLLQYLRQNNLEIIWTILGEKNTVGAWTRHGDEFKGRQEINGLYYLNSKGFLNGEIKAKTT